MKFRDGPQHIGVDPGVLKADEQNPPQGNEAARCRQVLASKSAPEGQKLKALNTLHRLHYGS
jgi:hypothetical protein